MIVEIPLSELTTDESEFLSKLFLSGKCKPYKPPQQPSTDDLLSNSLEYPEYLQHIRDTWK